jgi:hypothetical protein
MKCLSQHIAISLLVYPIVDKAITLLPVIDARFGGYGRKPRSWRRLTAFGPGTGLRNGRKPSAIDARFGSHSRKLRTAIGRGCSWASMEATDKNLQRPCDKKTL